MWLRIMEKDTQSKNVYSRVNFLKNLHPEQTQREIVNHAPLISNGLNPKKLANWFMKGHAEG